MGKKIEGKVCAFCNKYVIKNVIEFIKHLETCNPQQYEEFIDLLRWVRHERAKKEEG